MQINHNISAIIASGQLKTTNNALDKSMERLSSGLRINKSADDAAGLAISQKMKTQIAGLEQASRNASDGISVVQTTEGALGEVQSMLQRCRELAVQAANGTNAAEDREAIQKEIEELKKEIDRISEATEFNAKPLLDGSLDRKTFASQASISVISVSEGVPSDTYTFDVTQFGESAKITGNAVVGATGGVTPITADEEGSIAINGEEVKIEEGDTIDTVLGKIRELCNRCNITFEGAKNQPLSFTTQGTGKDQTISLFCNSTNLANRLGITTLTMTELQEDGTVKENKKANLSDALVAAGKDAGIELQQTQPGAKEAKGDFSNTATVVTDGNMVTITDKDGFEMKFEIIRKPDENGVLKPDIKDLKGVNLSVLDSGPLTFQIGANEGQTVDVAVPEVSVRTLGIELINVKTQELAEHTITTLDGAINIVSGIRAKLGAYQNRLEHAVVNLDTTTLNLTESLSRVEDVDMAEEMATYTQKNILSQAGVSMLSQANERPQQILSLLQ